jgi:hypothetical protein
MAKKKLGQTGPSSYWLKLSPSEREHLKRDIKLGFKGEELPAGLKRPSVRRVFNDVTPDDGFDLRHIERWDLRKIKKARERIAMVRTLTARPFVVKTPTTAKQKRALKHYTNLDLDSYRSFIVPVQDNKLDRIRIQEGKVTMVREYPGGGKGYQRLYLFKDYNGGKQPTTFNDMRRIVKKMLPDMPASIKGRDVSYILYTVPHGQIGNSASKDRVETLLTAYHNQYDANQAHKGFAESVTGIYMSGTDIQIAKAEKKLSDFKRSYRMTKKLRLSKRQRITGK